MNALLTAGATFGIFAAINVCWTLIIGTASIFSLATYAVVGTAAFVTSLLSIRAGIPWYALPPIGAFVGLGFGILIAAPALRLDGFYYALLTLGLNELFRVFFTTSKQFGSASGGLYGADSFIDQNWPPLTQSMVAYYASLALLIAASVSLPLHQRQAAWAACCAWRQRSTKLSPPPSAWTTSGHASPSSSSPRSRSASSAASMRRSIAASPMRSSTSRPCCSGSR